MVSLTRVYLAILIGVLIIASGGVTVMAADEAAPTTPAAQPAPPPASLLGATMLSVAQCPVRIFQIPFRMDFLAFTEDQKPKVKALAEKYDKRMTNAATEVAAAAKALGEALAADPASTTKVQEASARAGKAEAVALQAEVDYWMELKPLLNADQKKKVGDMLIRRSMASPMSRMGIPRDRLDPAGPPSGPNP